MEPEIEEGNIEYKLKLLGKDEKRINNLTSQMRWRCDEGNGECIYLLGVADDGNLIGMTEKEYLETIKVVNLVANKNQYIISIISKTLVEDDKYIYEILIRENNTQKYIDIKVSIAGSVDSGKSSIIGVLTNGKLDDGRGLARISVFNHPHELKTGRTTSIGHHILGFDHSGSVINYNDIGCKMSWPEIVSKSAKIINILDLCGHEKYLKTTIRGLTSSNPELCMIIVGANKGIKNDKVKNIRGTKGKYENMTREHIFLCVALNIPFAIIVTKIDMIIEQNIKNIYDETMKDIHKVIKSPNVRRQPLKIETNEDVVIAAKQIHSESIVPIFPVSNVTGDGLSNIKSFLNLIPQREQKKITNDVLLYIDGIWNVTGVGTVIGGQLISGEVKINDKLYTGPNGNSYEQLIIKSIQIKRVQVQKAIQGSYVCFGLKKGYDKKNIKRGNVLISNKEQQLSVKIFTANVKILRTHSTTIRVGYQPIVHCSTLRQSAILRKIENKVNSRNPEDTKDDDILRTGDTALVTFEFAFYPVFLTVGTKIVFAENRTKVVGIVNTIN